jgi:hypothetical protein
MVVFEKTSEVFMGTTSKSTLHNRNLTPNCMTLLTLNGALLAMLESRPRPHRSSESGALSDLHHENSLVAY